jgi:hypothetical protein
VGDFSRTSVEARIEAGCQEAIEKKIEEYTPAEREVAN